MEGRTVLETSKSPAGALRAQGGGSGTGSIPILMYHQVSPRPLPAFARYSVTSAAFTAQMKWLDVAGYSPITVDKLVEARRGRGTLPARPVVITFDDGFHELLDHAIPTLVARGFTATFFLVAGLMGKSGRWLREEIGTEIPLISWYAARELVAAGFQCGSHTMSHPRLSALSPSACRDELRDSRRLLEDELGCEVSHLAYPFGAFDDHVREIAAETGYRSACSTRRGLSEPVDDLLALRRISVYGHDSLVSFACRLATGNSPGELLRGGLQRRNRRKRGVEVG
jgi:peptidoglycan/xylan/chitin deacetylase (PgdA/CDA1 family)